MAELKQCWCLLDKLFFPSNTKIDAVSWDRREQGVKPGLRVLLYDHLLTALKHEELSSIDEVAASAERYLTQYSTSITAPETAEADAQRLSAEVAACFAAIDEAISAVSSSKERQASTTDDDQQASKKPRLSKKLSIEPLTISCRAPVGTEMVAAFSEATARIDTLLSTGGNGGWLTQDYGESREIEEVKAMFLSIYSHGTKLGNLISTARPKSAAASLTSTQQIKPASQLSNESSLDRNASNNRKQQQSQIVATSAAPLLSALYSISKKDDLGGGVHGLHPRPTAIMQQSSDSAPISSMKTATASAITAMGSRNSGSNVTASSTVFISSSSSSSSSSPSSSSARATGQASQTSQSHHVSTLTTSSSSSSQQPVQSIGSTNSANSTVSTISSSNVCHNRDSSESSNSITPPTYMGVTLKKTQPQQPTVREYDVEIRVVDRVVALGTFEDAKEAARAHDRALIRVMGPLALHRQPQLLNFPLLDYAVDSLDRFTRYDNILRRALFGSGWSRLTACDFSFLLLSSGSSASHSGSGGGGNGASHAASETISKSV